MAFFPRNRREVEIMNECPVTYFKNHALQILSSVAETGDEIILTRHGKPLVHIAPVKSKEKLQLGKLRNTIRINEDLVAPICDESEWNVCQ